jgi:predicted peptidase
MKNLITALFTLIFLSSFQSNDMEKTLNEINARFKNVQVSIINWPNNLQQKLGNMKKMAFMAVPRKKTTKKVPLLISLHGAGGKTWNLEEQLERSAKVKGLWLAELAGKELILIEPNSFEDWDPKTLDIMLDYLLEEYPQIDSNRVYVIGHSMGGKGTWEWIQHAPKRFAAAAPCGFSNVSDKDDIDKLVNLPIWGMVGADDVKNVEPVKKMVDLLRAAGNPNVQYTAFPNADHAAGNAKVFSATDCIDWMLTFSVAK